MHARLLNTVLLLGVFLGMIGVMPVSASSTFVSSRLAIAYFVGPDEEIQTNEVMTAFRQQQSPFANKSQGVKGKPISRAQAAQKIYTAFRKALDKASGPLPRTSPYQDVTVTDPDFHAIVVLNKLNIASPSTDDKFHPLESMSRYELSMAMDRLVTLLKPDGLDSLLSAKLSMPQDMPTTVEAFPSVEKMLKLGVVLVFTDGYFRGKRLATDTEVADALTAVGDLVKAGRKNKNHPDKK